MKNKKLREIAIIWNTEDVKRIDQDLTDDQAWEVLKNIEKDHDCNTGITWQVIENEVSLFKALLEEEEKEIANIDEVE